MSIDPHVSGVIDAADAHAQVLADIDDDHLTEAHRAHDELAASRAAVTWPADGDDDD